MTTRLSGTVGRAGNHLTRREVSHARHAACAGTDETQGSVPEGMPELAIAKVDSLLRLATEPVLFARVTLTMAADPAVKLPAMARASVDLGGRLVRAQAAGATMRESVEHMASRLRARLERAARNWEARRGSRLSGAPGEWRHQSIPAHHPPYFPRPAEGRQVIRRRSYAVRRETPEEALADLGARGHPSRTHRVGSSAHDRG